MRKLLLVVFLCTACLFIGNTVWAYPLMQLDIVGGTYDGDTTIIDGTSGSFDLVALLNPSSGNYYDEEPPEAVYYISAAIVPSTSGYPGPAPDVTGGCTGCDTFSPSGILSGTPTDLPSHGIFPTNYWQYAFTFDGTQRVEPYDVADGGDPVAIVPPTLAADTDFYAAYFAFDVSDVLAVDGVDAVHFDFYGYDGRGKIKFAPFSHDASAVPEPATLLLLGTGLVGLAGFGRKKFKK